MKRRCAANSLHTKNIGRARLHDDFVTRGAAVQCLAGIVANDPEEAV
jgi:hypothetical protein